MTCFAAAAASPRALRVAILESQREPATTAETLRAQIREKPGVAAVEFLDCATVAPTASRLLSDDAAVAIGACGWD